MVITTFFGSPPYAGPAPGYVHIGREITGRLEDAPSGDLALLYAMPIDALNVEHSRLAHSAD